METTKEIRKKKTEDGIIVVIRIAGMVKVKKDIAETLNKLRLRRKYSCVIINKNKSVLGMLQKVKYYVAYGYINKETLMKLIKERAESIERSEERRVGKGVDL